MAILLTVKVMIADFISNFGGKYGMECLNTKIIRKRRVEYTVKSVTLHSNQKHQPAYPHIVQVHPSLQSTPHAVLQLTPSRTHSRASRTSHNELVGDLLKIALPQAKSVLCGRNLTPKKYNS